MLNYNQQLPVYALEPDEIGNNRHFRMYNFNGTLPAHEDFLIPHRKDHYLLVFMRRGGSNLWIDMVPYMLRDNTVYFTRPNQIIVKDGLQELWSTGIAFTAEFLSVQGNAALDKLPLVQNLQNGHELLLSERDVVFVEDMIVRLNVEYGMRGEWQQGMLAAYLTVLLTYLSRLYVEQFKGSGVSADQLLLKSFQSEINERFRELREVSEYASLLNISAGHLSEVIKNQSGKPAIKHIHERQALEARRLLFHTGSSLKEIAFDLGFSDASYFNRFFKRECGVTPVEYRTCARKMYHKY